MLLAGRQRAKARYRTAYGAGLAGANLSESQKPAARRRGMFPATPNSQIHE